MRTVLSIVIILAFIFSFIPPQNSFASENRPLANLGSGLDDMFTGEVEIPDNIDETKTKGTIAYPECTDRTKDGVGRGIAKIVGGAWKLLTFWYPETED